MLSCDVGVLANLPVLHQRVANHLAVVQRVKHLFCVCVRVFFLKSQRRIGQQSSEAGKRRG